MATFTVFAWVFVRASSIWGPSLFHAVINNGSRALSYWVRIENQLVADAVLTTTMAAVVAVPWRTGQLRDELPRRFPHSAAAAAPGSRPSRRAALRGPRLRSRS